LRDRGQPVSLRYYFALPFSHFDSDFRGLVAQLVEQCPFNSKPPVLAIFGSFLFSFATIAGPLISLMIVSV